MRWCEKTFQCIFDSPTRNGMYKPKEFRGRGVKLVNMGEMFAYDFVGSQEMERIELTNDELEKNQLQEGDLLFGRRSLVESGAGKCSIVYGLDEPAVCESSIIRVRLDTDKCHPRFYYYWFKSHSGRGRISALVTGTNVKGIRASELKTLRVPVPSLDEQQSLISILQPYDDLIENNRRRIQLLEESARLLYREWFVHLRFPSHEHMKVVDGVPEGWKASTIADVAETVGGGTPSTKVPEYWEGGEVVWFTPTDLTGNDCLALIDSEKKITEEGLKRSSAKLLPPKTILMTSRASIGYFGLYDGIAATNQGFISIIPREDVTRMYLLYNLMGRKEEIKGLAGGTTYREINKTTFRSMTVNLPTRALCRPFNEFCDDVFNQVLNLKKQNRKLAKARDLLLPRLMNGEIAV